MLSCTYSLDCRGCDNYKTINAESLKLTASSEHTDRVMEQLRKLQDILSTKNMSVFYPDFKDKGIQFLPIEDLLPTREKIASYEKLCYVAHNKRMMDEPLLVITSSSAPVSDRLYIIDGHTRAAIMLARRGPQSRVRCRLLSCSLAKSYQKMHDKIKHNTPDLCAMLDRIYDEGNCPGLKKT